MSRKSRTSARKLGKPKSFPFRWLISAGIIAHLMAVFVPPLAFQTRGPLGSSPSVETLIAPVRSYSQFLYIDRGYAFFAPDPGPSHLIQVAIDGGENDEKMTERIIPNLEEQWPRLSYHRHFMLAEFLNEIYHPQGPPPQLAEQNPEEASRWIQSRARYVAARNSMLHHLEHQNPGKRVRIRRLEHQLPSFVEMVNNPIELRDPQLYRVLADPAVVSTGATADVAPLPYPDPRSNERSAQQRSKQRLRQLFRDDRVEERADERAGDVNQ